jgi:hypothetical protein
VISIPANYMVSRWLGCAPGRVWELTRLWAPDGHPKNLLTEAIAFAVREFHKLNLADALISYADPNAGHHGGIYKAASWTQLGQSEEVRAYRKDGQIVARRKFHSGSRAMIKAEIEALGYQELKLPGKWRFARGLTREGKRAVRKLIAARSEASPGFAPHRNAALRPATRRDSSRLITSQRRA